MTRSKSHCNVPFLFQGDRTSKVEFNGKVTKASRKLQQNKSLSAQVQKETKQEVWRKQKFIMDETDEEDNMKELMETMKLPGLHLTGEESEEEKESIQVNILTYLCHFDLLLSNVDVCV